MGGHAIAGNRLHRQGVRLNGRPLGRSRVLVAGTTLALHPTLESIPPRTILRTKTSRVRELADMLAPANVPIIFMTLGSWTNKSDFQLWRHGVGVVGGSWGVVGGGSCEGSCEGSCGGGNGDSPADGFWFADFRW